MTTVCVCVVRLSHRPDWRLGGVCPTAVANSYSARSQIFKRVSAIKHQELLKSHSIVWPPANARFHGACLCADVGSWSMERQRRRNRQTSAHRKKSQQRIRCAQVDEIEALVDFGVCASEWTECGWVAKRATRSQCAGARR